MICKNKVVSIEYVLTDPNGQVIDQSNGEPLLYLHGAGNIIPGLENALTDRRVGDRLTVQVPAAEGYGEHDQARVFSVPRTELPPNLEPGMAMELESGAGDAFLVEVVEVTDEEVRLDANHPLAGVDLTFEVEIVEVRDGTPDELSHGHVHGPHGHHHG